MRCAATNGYPQGPSLSTDLGRAVARVGCARHGSPHEGLLTRATGDADGRDGGGSRRRESRGDRARRRPAPGDSGPPEQLAVAAGRRAAGRARLRPATRAVAARASRRRPRVDQCVDRGGHRTGGRPGCRRLRRSGRRSLGRERGPRRRAADDVRACAAAGRRWAVGGRRGCARHGGRGAPGLPPSSLPALGPAPRRDLP